MQNWILTFFFFFLAGIQQGKSYFCMNYILNGIWLSPRYLCLRKKKKRKKLNNKLLISLCVFCHSIRLYFKRSSYLYIALSCHIIVRLICSKLTNKGNCLQLRPCMLRPAVKCSTHRPRSYSLGYKFVKLADTLDDKKNWNKYEYV